jgi:hypothetical protein
MRRRRWRVVTIGAGNNVKRECVEEAETTEQVSSTAALRPGADVGIEDDDERSTRKKLWLTT